MSNNNSNKFFQNLPNIPWPLIVVLFFTPASFFGVVLLILKILKEANPAPKSWEQMEHERIRQEELVRMQQKRTQAARQTGTTTTYAKGSKSVQIQRGADGQVDLTTTSAMRTPEQQPGAKKKSSSKGSYTHKRKFPYKPIKNGKGIMILGGIALFISAIITGNVISDWNYNVFFWQILLQDLFPAVLCFTGGLGALLWGVFRSRQAKKFRKYLARISNEPLIPLRPLAESIPASMDEVCQTLQQMIDQGLFGDRAYIDISTETLVVDNTVATPKPVEKKAPAKQEKKTSLTYDDQILNDIRRANDRIPGEEISQKIDRIEEITRHILEYLKKHPERSSELHTFLDYYLPTTLKMLNTYAELDEKNMTGENIDATKRRIEGILDKVVEGFELQLDKLFEGDMLDISADIDVMEKMLQRDGLSGDARLRPKSVEAQAVQGYTPSLTLDPSQSGSAAAAMPQDQAKKDYDTLGNF